MDVAASSRRAKVRVALVHSPEVALKISTRLERPELVRPPPNRARFETDVAARYQRATEREAVVHNPDAALKISTRSEGLFWFNRLVRPPPNKARFETDVAAR
jgi:hypothetical protein